MRIAAVEAYGIGDDVVDLWRENGHESLLPVQELALTRHNALKGHNLLVFSPTSSGKTFVGEMAAAKKALRNSRVLYLVPQKALAEEKYREFRAKYARFGIRTVISTRDHRDFDTAINGGRFHVAVVVFEKMQSLLVTNPSLLSSVGLVVVDELQMIGDKERGANLEVLLTKIKLAERPPQIIGLSAVLGNSRRLADWLGAEFCSTRRRPVELRKGVLWNGTFHYVEHNSGAVGHEALAPPPDYGLVDDILVGQVKSFVDAGEQCMVFCKAKRDCTSTAVSIAKQLKERPAEGALNELRDLEDSRNKEVLAWLLSRGIAYHNSDLDADHRDLIERHFRDGEIMALCATTTLALGMNLPAMNVFVDPERWDQDRTGHWARVPIAQAEYENMSGRAGRLGLVEEFGRGIIIAESKFEARKFWNCFVRGQLGSIKPALDRDPLSRHVLSFIASGTCRTAVELQQVLLSSFTGETRWRGGARERTFREKLRSALRICLAEGLVVRREYGRLTATELGRVTATKGITVETAARLARFARQHKDNAEDVQVLEVLLCLSRTEDGERIYFNMSSDEYRAYRYSGLLEDRAKELPEKARERLAEEGGPACGSYEGEKQIKKALILHEWVTETPTKEIEKRYRCYAGSIAHMAGEFSWLAEALASIAKVCGWPKTEVARLRALSKRLVFGVPAGGAEIARARVRGLGRGRVAGLLEAGLDTLEKVAAAPRKQIERLVTKPVAAEFLKRVASLLAHEQLEVDNDEVPPPGEVTEWTPSFPPADAAGLPYLSNAKVHVVGCPRGRRFLVRVEDREVWLTNQLFEAILRLVVAAKTTDIGWLPGKNLSADEPLNPHQIIWRLKQEMRSTGVDADALIESNDKHCRLSVPPANIAVDADQVGRFAPELAGIVDGLKGTR